jgi:hypothetical protein
MLQEMLIAAIAGALTGAAEALVKLWRNQK